MQKIAVIIPTYKARNHILQVIENVGPEVEKIYVVDDFCPDGSGDLVAERCSDSRVVLIKHEVNQGVGGAVMSGYMAAIRDGMEILVKIDSDGQMDPALIPNFVAPIINAEADYTKGNRFFHLDSLQTMPRSRLFGNAVLSFMCKFSSGYWNIFDPTNGFTAVHSHIIQYLPFDKISKRFFFETDMLFRLNLLKAVVLDIPINSHYGTEVSNLKISKIIPEFLWKHGRNFVKRIFYNYYLRDMSIASLELLLGCILIIFGTVFGVLQWTEASRLETVASSGTVMLSAVPILIGLQLLLAFLSFDIASVPRRPLNRDLKGARGG